MQWSGRVALIEPHYPKADRGRKPYPVKAMLRIHLLQNRFSLSAPYKIGRRVETVKAQAGTKVAPPFRVIKQQFGYVKAPFSELTKNTAQLTTLVALSNLRIARRHLLSVTGAVRL